MPRVKNPSSSERSENSVLEIDSDLIGNLQKVFGDPNIWVQPPPPTEKLGLHPTSQQGEEDAGCESQIAIGAYSASDEPNARDCAHRALPDMIEKQCGKGDKHVRSANMAPPTLPAPNLNSTSFEDIGLERGEKASKKEHFIAWKFLLRYPDLYVGKANNPAVAPYFEEGGDLLSIQPWDFFYLFEPNEEAQDPIVFVPTRQLEAFLLRINRQLGINLAVPDNGQNKFYMRFGVLGTPVPRYLGHTSDVASYKKLVENLHSSLPEPRDDIAQMTQPQLKEFTKVMKTVKESWQGTGKGKGKGQNKNRAAKRFEDRKGWGRGTKRVQRYLGLREKTTVHMDQDQGPSKKLSIDTNNPAPFKNEGEVVLICIDIEAYERSPEIITELGFAILDTENLVGVPPGIGALNWFPVIQGRHIRIKEYSYMRNTRFLGGCPEHFMFGSSEFVPSNEIRTVIEEIMLPKAASGALKRVVLVGHDVKNDVDYLKSLGFDVHKMENLMEVIDSQKLHQHRSRFYNGQGLSAILHGLSISHKYLHNAGNDAVYTMQSLLRLAVLKRLESLASASKGTTHSAGQEGESEPREDIGWSTGGEDTDGGYPLVNYPHALQKQMARMQIADL